MEQKLIFENWKARCSSLGHILTCLPEPITPELENELTELIKERSDKKAANKTFAKYKQEKIDKLQKVKDGIDVLPPGCITHLQDVFRSQFWGRRHLLNNKYLTKGNMVESDALALLSYVDKGFYLKNDEFIENDYIQGTPDNMDDAVIDTKSCWDLSTFDNAELTSLYEWQIKGYCFILGKRNGELVYALLNSPAHLLDNEKRSLLYSMGSPADTEDRWIEAATQLEKNHIFDMTAFKDEYPNYDMVTKIWDFDIHPAFRIKRFPVTLNDGDIEHIIRRVKMCRKWLCAKEQEVLEKLKTLQQ